MQIRPATDGDYPAIVEVIKSAHPPTATIQDAVVQRFFDDALREKYELRRYVAEIRGRIVGCSHRQRFMSVNHPGKFYSTVVVDSRHQQKGIGTALYDHLMRDMCDHGLRTLCARARADMVRGIRFLKQRGFQESDSELESVLHLEHFDDRQYDGAVDSVLEQGIEITTLTEWRRRPDWDRELYKLIIAIQSDMPMHDTYTPFSFDEFLDVFMKLPMLYPDAYFIAQDKGRCIGVSILQYDRGYPQQLDTDDTGTLPEHRRRGIATALKLTGIRFARSMGYKRIRTFNATTNDAMLSLNEKLGFMKYPPWQSYSKTL